jgi:hypothetical protein
MQRMMASVAESQPIAAARQVLPASAANDMVQFKATTPAASRPMAHSAARVEEHVVLLRQTFIRLVSFQACQ